MNNNIVKTLNYIKKNGLTETCYAVRERLEERKLPPYVFREINSEERLEEVEKSLGLHTRISVLVPAYETKPEYLKALLDCFRAQTYSNWELVIADASSTGAVKEEIEFFGDARIKYVHLEKNLGISDNSNAGLLECTGEYIGLLDHDDLLTSNALYEMAKRIEDFKQKGITLQVLYSDEDKTDGENSRYFEPNIKPDFNLDLLLSNNYICHFMVIKNERIRSLGFRSDFDGAQDHDLILRTVYSLQKEYGREYRKYINHIDKVLYHWRCHEESTAGNPKSKLYAYESGKRAVESYLNTAGIAGRVVDLPHMGFFDIEYDKDMWIQRPEVAGTGGRIIKKNRVVGGVMDENGNVMFLGLHKRNSGGYLHRAACRMTVECVDIRCAALNPVAQKVLEEMKKNAEPRTEEDYKKLSVEFSKKMTQKGYVFVYDPKMLKKAEN